MASIAIAHTDQKAIVQGHVLRLDRSPVRGASVEISPASFWNGFTPPPVITDEQGFFRIEYPAIGPAWVTASKMDEGYPNASLGLEGRAEFNGSLYGKRKHSSMKLVDLKPGSVSNIELRLGKPDAFLVCTVFDPFQQPIRDARILIQFAEYPQVMMSSTLPKDGIFYFVLPKHAVSIEVSAPGYTTWHYQNPNTGLPALTAKDREHIHLNAVLHPVDGH